MCISSPAILQSPLVIRVTETPDRLTSQSKMGINIYYICNIPAWDTHTQAEECRYPARPVRPTLCTYSSMFRGKSKLKTCEISWTSSPLEARSVATRIRTRPAYIQNKHNYFRKLAKCGLPINCIKRGQYKTGKQTLNHSKYTGCPIVWIHRHSHGLDLNIDITIHSQIDGLRLRKPCVYAE